VSSFDFFRKFSFFTPSFVKFFLLFSSPPSARKRKKTFFSSHFPFSPFFFLPSIKHAPDDHVKGMGVDPRSMAQRIMDIRSQLAKEWMEDLSDVSEENALLLRESAAASLKTITEHPFDSSTDEDEGASSSEDEGGQSS
jgi:hypothetical protein